MKTPPTVHQRAALLALPLILAIFLVTSLVSAQDISFVLPATGAAPTELAQPFTGTGIAHIKAVSALTATVYLPIVMKPNTCNLNAQEQAIANLASQHPDQGRPFMNCHPILAQVARERALDMGMRDYFDHVNPDGYGPNYLVRQAGYVLPPLYYTTDTANNIESIAAGLSSASLTWNGWLNSAEHRVHVLGEGDFWSGQTNYGIGYVYVPGSTYGHYWVFISAHPEE